MSGLLGNAEIGYFREVIGNRLGLQFDDGKMDFLADTLRQRLTASGSASSVYLSSLASNAGRELQVLASLLTVPETYFFRNPDHFRALAERVLPERMSAQSGVRRLRLLSAGCASGEEAHSLAMTLRDRFPDISRWDVTIRGVDINPNIVEKAKRGRYSPWSLRETPVEARQRYFRKDNAEYVLNSTIREMASFEEGNLADDSLALLNGEKFDVIFCRNVIMYLVPERMERVVQRLTHALLPGGFLFLGHAETLRGLTHDFHLRHTHDTFYYQKKEAAAQTCASIPPARPYQEVPWSDATWVDAIRAASERIHNLARDCGRPGPLPASPSIGGQRRPAVDLGLASELLRQEKFREALEVLRQLGPDSTADVDTLLLRAILLTNCGEVAVAEAVCAQLLMADDLNAGAHYVMALCREYAGDRRGAMEQDRLAVHLDPLFAIPHLHLGLLSQRSGDLDTGRQELRQAVTLLLREDPSRILLFGGGFSRESLLDFTRAQLRSCGGAP